MLLITRKKRFIDSLPFRISKLNLIELEIIV